MFFGGLPMEELKWPGSPASRHRPWETICNVCFGSRTLPPALLCVQSVLSPALCGNPHRLAGRLVGEWASGWTAQGTCFRELGTRTARDNFLKPPASRGYLIFGWGAEHTTIHHMSSGQGLLSGLWSNFQCSCCNLVPSRFTCCTYSGACWGGPSRSL